MKLEAPLTTVLTKFAEDPLGSANGRLFIHLGTTCKVRSLGPVRLDYVCQNPQSTCSVGEGAFSLEPTPIMPNPFLLPHLLISKALLGSAGISATDGYYYVYYKQKISCRFTFCLNKPIPNSVEFLTTVSPIPSQTLVFVSKTTHHGIAFPTELRHSSAYHSSRHSEHQWPWWTGHQQRSGSDEQVKQKLLIHLWSGLAQTSYYGFSR